MTYLAGRLELAGEFRSKAGRVSFLDISMPDQNSLSDLSDEELMAHVARQDRQAFERLVERYLNRMMAVAYRMTANRAEAEDILQDAFLRLWRSASGWQQGQAKFSTWFHRVVINLCIDRSRKRKFSPLEDADDIADEGVSAEKRLQIKDQNAKVAAALAELPQKQRAAITLCYYESMSNWEAAEILQTSVKAVESLLVRARRTLAIRLESLKDEILTEK